MRRDEVEAAWAWIDPILNGWEEHFQAPRPYPAGSNGPEQAHSLLARQGSSWHC
ncbi:Glucose-6-phosphate 1-dehydrogenase [compost metagenome]